MKQLSIILNVILVVAVGVLYYFFFSGKEGPVEPEEESAFMGDINIAYVNSDTLLEKYKLSTELLEGLEAKRDKLEAEFRNRQEGLQQEFSNYQRNQQNLTIGQARAIEEDLLKKQQNLQQYQQSLTQQLVSEQNKINTTLYERVAKFLKDYGKKNDLQIVLTYTKGNPNVLYAHDSLNITQSVIKGLNVEYDNEKTSGTEPDTTSTE